MPPSAKRRREDDQVSPENVEVASVSSDHGPGIHLPPVPGMYLPRMDLPSINLPGMNIGDVYSPGMSLPGNHLPGMNPMGSILPGKPETSTIFRPSLPVPAGVAVPSVDDMINSLDRVQIHCVLVSAIRDDPTNCALSRLTDAWIESAMRQRNEVIDFDYHSKSVWRTLNTTYSRLSGSRQYHVAGDAFDSVIGEIEEISGQVTAASSYGTKLSALETLRKIGKSIVLAGDCLGHEVHKQFQYDSQFTDAMWHIVECMTEEERLDARENVSEASKGRLEEKIKWLVRESQNYCIFEQLHEVLDFLMGVPVLEFDEENEAELEEDDE